MLNWQEVSTHVVHPKMDVGPELCHWKLKGQLIVGLRVGFIWPYEPLQTGAKLGTPRGGTTLRCNLQPLPDRHVSGRHRFADVDRCEGPMSMMLWR